MRMAKVNYGRYQTRIDLGDAQWDLKQILEKAKDPYGFSQEPFSVFVINWNGASIELLPMSALEKVLIFPDDCVEVISERTFIAAMDAYGVDSFLQNALWLPVANGVNGGLLERCQEFRPSFDPELVCQAVELVTKDLKAVYGFILPRVEKMRIGKEYIAICGGIRVSVIRPDERMVKLSIDNGDLEGEGIMQDRDLRVTRVYAPTKELLNKLQSLVSSARMDALDFRLI